MRSHLSRAFGFACPVAGRTRGRARAWSALATRTRSHPGTSALAPVARGYHPAAGRESKRGGLRRQIVVACHGEKGVANSTTSSSADAGA